MTNRQMAELAAKQIAEEYGLELEYSNRIPLADIIERAYEEPELCGIRFTGATGQTIFTCVLPKEHVGDHDDAPNRGQLLAGRGHLGKLWTEFVWEDSQTGPVIKSTEAIAKRFANFVLGRAAQEGE